MHRILPAAFALLSSLPAAAQDQMTMPSREVFVDQQCVPAMLRRTVLADDAVRDAYAHAACECSYRMLSDRASVSREVFDAANTLCQAEFDNDPDAFLGKYRAAGQR